MAWNEPGNNGNKDPWGNRGSDQGPPDLDEAFKKLQDQLGGIFGGGKGGGDANVMSSLFLVIAGLALWFAYAAFYQVQEAERAVVLRAGSYLETKSPGLRFNIPVLDKVHIVNVQAVRNYTSDALMLTEDEGIVRVTMTVQYKVSDVAAFVLKVDQPEVSLKHAADSAIRHVAGASSMNAVLTEQRAAIGDETLLRLQGFMDNYKTGILISNITLDDAQPPAEVSDAFDDVNRASEDKQRLINKAETYANTVVPEARGKAARIETEAEAYQQEVIAKASGDGNRFTALLTEYEKAPKVTRERLYIDTMQSVLSNTSKVMLDVEGGNNMMYLPLDKLISEGNKSLPGSSGVSETDIQELIERAVQQQLNQRNTSNTRRREFR